MHVTLYKYTGERNRVDKSNRLETILSVQGAFKGDVSLMSPVLLLSLPTEAVKRVTDENGNVIAGVVVGDIAIGGVLNFNYFYVQELRRYYFLRDLQISSGSLVVVSGYVDPLYSFMDSILENNLMIERNEFNFDPLLEDSLLTFMDTKDVVEYVPSKGALVNTELGFQTLTNVYNIVLNLVTDVAPDTTAINAPAGSGLPKVYTRYFSSHGASCPYAVPYDGLGTIFKRLISDESAKASFVKSVVALPFNPVDENEQGEYPLYFGVSSISGNRIVEDGSPLGGIICRPFSFYRVVADFSIVAPTDFYEYAPWSDYEIYIPYLGWKPLDYQVVKGHRLLVFYSVNFENGAGDVYLWDYTSKRLIFSSPCQIGIKLSMSSTNYQQIEEERTALGANLGLSLISSSVGMFTGNPLAIAGGVVGMGKSITDFVVNSSRLHVQAQASFSGGVGGLFAPQDVRIRVTKPVPTITDFDRFAHLYGRPLRDTRKLKNLSGMTITGAPHLENIEALDQEKNEIENALRNGVIL